MFGLGGGLRADWERFRREILGGKTGLGEFEQDLHLHVHLENNILFPRAVELERIASGGRDGAR